MDEVMIPGTLMEEIQRHVGTLEPMSPDEWLQEQASALNSRVGALKYIDCPKCLNRGEIAVVRGDRVVMQECSCMVKRRAMRRAAESGLSDMITRYTFKTFEPVDDWQRSALEMSRTYAENPKGWMIMTGSPGTGKTHLCTAVCGDLIKQGYDVRYFLWRTDAPVLKAFAGTVDYEEKVRPYKTVKVLYIDDFFKGKTITDADINLAFDILNARYNNVNLITIISSELTIEDLLDVDQALGSRIYERRGVYIKTKGKPNWRLKDWGEPNERAERC